MKPQCQPKLIVRFILLCLLTLIGAACTNSSHDWRGTLYEPPNTAPNIRVQNEDGISFDLAEQRGSITLLYFGYSYCPDVCPATVAIMSQVFEQLKPSPEDMRFIMISVDPERETPNSVDAYMRRFHPDFLGLWIDRMSLEQVLDEYGVVAIREPSENPETYLITHTARVFLIDQAGNLIAHYPFGTTPDDFMHDLDYLLREE
jgi:protein SCO1/2